MAVHFNLAISTTSEEYSVAIAAYFKEKVFTVSNGEVAAVYTWTEKVANEFLIGVSVDGMHYGFNSSNHKLVDRYIEVGNHLLEILRKEKSLFYKFAFYECEVYDDFLNSLFWKELMQEYTNRYDFFKNKYSGLVISNDLLSQFNYCDAFEEFNSKYMWINNKTKHDN